MEIKVTQKLLDHIGRELGYDIKKCEILGHGEHNMNYVLKTDKENFVLRIYANTQFDNSKKEFEIMKRLNGKFSPKALYLDTSKEFIAQDYMIQKFIAGKILKEFNKNNISKVASLLKEIHKIKNIKKDREWKKPIGDWTKNNLLENSKFLGKEFNKEIENLYHEVLNRLEKIRPFVEKYKRTSLTHDDPIPENFMEKDNGELVLIDWELATFDYYFLDFGAVIAESHIDKELEKIFLESYGFGLNEVEKKIVDVVKINRILSLIGWLIERIATCKQGKELCAFQDKKKYDKKLKEELKHIRLLLNESN